MAICYEEVEVLDGVTMRCITLDGQPIFDDAGVAWAVDPIVQIMGERLGMSNDEIFVDLANRRFRTLEDDDHKRLAIDHARDRLRHVIQYWYDATSTVGGVRRPSLDPPQPEHLRTAPRTQAGE